MPHRFICRKWHGGYSYTHDAMKAAVLLVRSSSIRKVSFTLLNLFQVSSSLRPVCNCSHVCQNIRLPVYMMPGHAQPYCQLIHLSSRVYVGHHICPEKIRFCFIIPRLKPFEKVDTVGWLYVRESEGHIPRLQWCSTFVQCRWHRRHVGYSTACSVDNAVQRWQRPRKRCQIS